MPVNTDPTVLFNFDSPIYFGEIFSGLAGSTRHSISEITKCETFRQGECIFNQGELPIGVITLDKGEAVLVCNERSRPFERDEVVGLTEMLADVPLETSLIAAGETVVAIIPASEFVALVKKENLLCFRLLQFLSSRYQTKLEYFNSRT